MWSEPNWEYVNKAPSGGKLSLVLHVSLLYLCVLDRKYKHLSVNRYISSNIISAYVFLIRVVLVLSPVRTHGHYTFFIII